MQLILILFCVLPSVTALTSTITFNGVLHCVRENDQSGESPRAKNFTVEVWEQDNGQGGFVGLNKDDLLYTRSVRPGESFTIEVTDSEFWDLEPYILIKNRCQNEYIDHKNLLPTITETVASVNFEFFYCHRYPGSMKMCASKKKEYFNVEQW